MKRAALFIYLSLLTVFCTFTARAATPPFTEPAEWATICTQKTAISAPIIRGTNCRWLKLDGVWRRYVVYVPTKPSLGAIDKWPLVLMLHGSNQTGEHHYRTSQWREVADKIGLIVIFPTGWRYQLLNGKAQTKWHNFWLIDEINTTVRLDGYPTTSPYPARDVMFISRMIADVTGKVSINSKRIYASGFSNGGTMIPRLASQMSQVFAALSCAGFCNPSPDTIVPPRNVPMLYGLGNKDEGYIRSINNRLTTPPISIIPMAWADAEQYLDPVISKHLANLHLESIYQVKSDGATGVARTSVEWSTPMTGNTDGNVFALDLMRGLHHNYALARTSTNPSNNDGNYSFAARSWQFFSKYRLP